MIADAIRYFYFALTGLYLGLACTVIRAYFSAPPRSQLRRLHVVCVAAGTSLLVIGHAGLSYQLLGHPLQWYGAPVGLAGTLLIVVALWVLHRDMRRRHRQHHARRSGD